MNDALTTLKPRLTDIPGDRVEAPTMPVAVAIQEAIELESTARDLWPHLEAVGATKAWLDELRTAADALREAETAWSKIRYTGRSEAEKALFASAERVRGELIAAASYALATDEGAQARLAAIREGEGVADLIQDLYDLAALAGDKKAALEKIHFDFATAESARAIGEEISRVRASAVSAKVLDESKELRDRAFTYLSGFADRVRAAGLYAFRNAGDRDRLAGFRSRHAVAKGRRQRSARHVTGSAAANPGVATAPATPTSGSAPTAPRNC